MAFRFLNSFEGINTSVYSTLRLSNFVMLSLKKKKKNDKHSLLMQNTPDDAL